MTSVFVSSASNAPLISCVLAPICGLWRIVSTVRSDCSNVLVIQSAVSQQLIEGLLHKSLRSRWRRSACGRLRPVRSDTRKAGFRAKHVRVRLKTAGNKLTAFFIKNTCDSVNTVHAGAGHHADVNRNIRSAHKYKGLIELRPQILTSRLVRTCRS